MRLRSGVSAPTIRAIEQQDGNSTVEPEPKGTREHRQHMRDESVRKIVASMKAAGIVFLNDGSPTLVGIKGKIKSR